MAVAAHHQEIGTTCKRLLLQCLRDGRPYRLDALGCGDEAALAQHLRQMLATAATRKRLLVERCENRHLGCEVQERSSVGYRAGFMKTEDGWRMNALVAGD